METLLENSEKSLSGTYNDFIWISFSFQGGDLGRFDLPDLKKLRKAEGLYKIGKADLNREILISQCLQVLIS